MNQLIENTLHVHTSISEGESQRSVRWMDEVLNNGKTNFKLNEPGVIIPCELRPANLIVAGIQ